MQVSCGMQLEYFFLNLHVRGHASLQGFNEVIENLKCLGLNNHKINSCHK